MIHTPKKIVRLATVVVAVFGLLTVSCGSDETTSSESEGGSTLGAQVYGTSCASCHGTELQGTDKGPSHLSIIYEPNHHGDDAFRSAIANGSGQHHWTFGDMPPVKGLTGEEVDAVIAFVRSEQQRQGFQQ